MHERPEITRDRAAGKCLSSTTRQDWLTNQRALEAEGFTEKSYTLWRQHEARKWGLDIIDDAASGSPSGSGQRPVTESRSASPLQALLSDTLAMCPRTLQELMPRMLAAPKAAEDQIDQAETLPTADSLVRGGVAVVPIQGLMVKRTRVFSGWFSSMTIAGTDHWADVIEDLTQRADVQNIVLDIDSGGGQVAGTERLADAVWRARQSGKWVVAVANEFAASAALWVASQANYVTVPRSGTIGSLGVYTLHFDDTRFLSEQFGIEKSVIHRGKYKAVDERPLDDDSRADLQRFVDAKYSVFVDAVARGRGVKADEVVNKWGDSRLFSGAEAVANGLADAHGTLQEVISSLR